MKLLAEAEKKVEDAIDRFMDGIKEKCLDLMRRMKMFN